MNTIDKFKAELKQLLIKYQATIDYNYDDYLDWQSVYGGRMEVNFYVDGETHILAKHNYIDEDDL